MSSQVLRYGRLRYQLATVVSGAFLALLFASFSLANGSRAQQGSDLRWAQTEPSNGVPDQPFGGGTTRPFHNGVPDQPGWPSAHRFLLHGVPDSPDGGGASSGCEYGIPDYPAGGGFLSQVIQRFRRLISPMTTTTR